LPFHIHISDAEQAYLDNLPLSAEAKRRINQFVDQFVTNVSDEFRLDPLNRSSPDSSSFLVQYILLDVWGDGRVHTIDLHVRDDQVQFGVLQIVFIDIHP
jgi:hypothetical protein